ncbi:MAG TPA: hypothetical protein VME44_05055 [Streptosporangiaceae bacterium]|nr:hypothetical protein [Streptosporangiaceae bacterium]
MSRLLSRAVLALAAASMSVSLAGCGGQSSQSEHTATASPLRHSARSPAGTPALAIISASARADRRALEGSHLLDLTWLSSQRGWALADARCSAGLCPRVAVTRNGGRSWEALSVPASLKGNWQTEISQIRFATVKVGYLFGPALYQTRDGGRTWRRIRSRPVEALEPRAGTIVRIAYDHLGCPGPCNRVVQTAAAGSGAWHTLLRIPIARADGNISAQIIRAAARVIYVPIYANLASGVRGAKAVIFRSIDAGRRWQRLPDPCIGTGTDTHAAVTLSAGPRGYLSVLCDSILGTGRTFIRTSQDYGSRWGQPRTVPSGMQLLASPGPGRLMLATGGVSGSGPFTYRLDVSRDGGLHWTTVVTGTTEVSPSAAIPAVLGFGGAGFGWWASTSQEIWLTRDDGLRWRQRPFPG